MKVLYRAASIWHRLIPGQVAAARILAGGCSPSSTLTADQKQQLFGNIAAARQGVPEDIIRRQLGHFAKAEPAYAAGVAKALGLQV